MKLMLLIIPTIQKIVKPAANGPPKKMTPGPNGSLMKSMTMPAAIANTARPIWPTSCQRARRSKKSSRAPERGRRGAAGQERGQFVGRDRHAARSASAWLTSRKTALVSRNPAAIASPPARGIGTVLTRRSSGRSTISWWTTNRRTTGVSARVRMAAPAKTTTMGAQERARRRR